MNNNNKDLWCNRIENYRESGQSAKLWCTENNVSLSALRYWICKLNQNNTVTTEIPQFIQIATSNGRDQKTPVTVKLGAFSVEIHEDCSPDTIRTVFDILQTYA